MKYGRSEFRRGAAPRLGRRSGYSFVDLMVTLTLVSIMGAIGTPVFYPALIEYRLNWAAEELIGAVEYARSRAVVTGSETRVTFDAASETVVVEERRLGFDLVEDAGTNFAAAAIETRTFQVLENPVNRGEGYRLTLSQEGWGGSVDLETADLGGSEQLTFDGRGVPSSGGTVSLASAGVRLSLTLDAGTGRLTR